MKILLTTLNAKYIHSNLALKYLYTAAPKEAHNMEIREFTINNSRDYILTELINGEYDIVCFSCYIWNIEHIKALCEDLKKAQPTVKIILGGPEVSYEPEQFMAKNKAVSFIIYGEGEYVFKLLCEEFIRGTEDYEKIKGLIYRQDGKIFINPPMPTLNFETIPFPYSTFPCEADKIIYYESARGCPYRCSYCLSSIEKKVRALSLERVKQDLGYFLYRKVKQVKFIDRTFNWDEKRAYEIFKYILEMNQGSTNFHFEICGDLLSERTFQLLEKAPKGLFQFEIGIQSTCEDTLKAINRNSDVEKLLENIKRLSNMGNCHVHVDLIAGLPFEDYERFRNSFNDAYKTSADALQLGFLKLLSGTEIQKNAELYQYTYKSRPPYEVISNEFICAKELAKLKMVENVLDIYYNKGGYESALKYMTENFARTPFDFYEQFSEFYYIHGYQNVSHKKEDQYRILYKFAECVGRIEEVACLLESDLKNTMNFDAVKKFERKGWNIL